MADPSHLIRQEIVSLTPYNAGLTIGEVRRLYDPPRIAKLGSNENPYGPSPAVAEALAATTGQLHLYPDPSGRDLAAAIADRHGVDPAQVILGNGSEDLIAVVCRTVLSPGDRMATLYPSFPLHEDYARLMGADVDRVTARADLSIDADGLLSAVRAAPKLVMFANPMNPVGSWLTGDQMRCVVETLPVETLLVVDEAYAEYAVGDGYVSVLDALKAADRSWLVLRTFSKAYGLAGLRIGYGIASSPALVAYLDRARTPFNTSALAQAAARAALEDPGHMATCISIVRSERARVREFLASRGIMAAPSNANFLFFDCGMESTVFATRLLERGVVVKPWKQDDYRSFVRVSIGLPSENEQFMAAIAETIA
ncbi:histidinol-phosphate transaminase [Rhizobium sp. TRM95111]|uniref:histidinol-phosphate transaminase n=1 Tax=Rhizobium alarense TaxID=2846851 RepID=UPI001F47BEF5|nr:histidinol-phosphate transaminase [Rhizobium alarense]MCF3640285.1 histidinol-phosphate transaminase [Rhizobium alarense]